LYADPGIFTLRCWFPGTDCCPRYLPTPGFGPIVSAAMRPSAPSDSPTEFQSGHRTFRNPGKKLRACPLPEMPALGSACKFLRGCTGNRRACRATGSTEIHLTGENDARCRRTLCVARCRRARGTGHMDRGLHRVRHSRPCGPRCMAESPVLPGRVLVEQRKTPRRFRRELHCGRLPSVYLRRHSN
jgi:hypothetical protein